MSEATQDRRETITAERVPTASEFERILTRVVEETERRVAARPNPMALDTWEQLERFSQVAANSDLVPKDYRGKPDNIILAVMKGKEVGLPPIQALQSIAVVNGRTTIWGDAIPGLCMASGKLEDFREYFEGEEGTDGFTAICEVKRRGMEIKSGRFSQGDAKRAGLYGQAVHGKYPRRMAQMRARVAFRDAFPDVLQGLDAREAAEEDAVATPGWTMPQPERGWFTHKPQAQSDGWDDTWFAGVIQKLAGEPNAWKWLDLLVAVLGDAPTLRDVNEIGDLPMVAKVRDGAPPEGVKTIDDAFASARDRFVVAGQPTNKTMAALNEALKPKPPADAAEIDSAGVIYDERIHSSAKTKTADGKWRMRRGADPTVAPQTVAPTPPADDGGLFDTSEPARTQKPGFSFYLLDETGRPLPDDDGVLEPYTDPVAWAREYMTVKDTMFPGDLPGFEQANGEAARAAIVASREVVSIIAAGAGDTLVEDDDDDMQPIPPPLKRAEMPAYKASLKVRLDGCTTPEAINHVIDVDGPTFDAFQSVDRLECKALVETRQRAITPPTVATNLDAATLAETILNDLASLKTIAEFRTWQTVPSAIAEVERVRRESPEHYATLQTAITQRETELKVAEVKAEWEGVTPNDVHEELVRRINSAADGKGLVAINATPSFVAGGAIVKPYPDLMRRVQEAYFAKKKQLGG